MIKVKYAKYLENQKMWAESLTRQADLDGGVTDREAAFLAILAVDRLIAMSLRSTVILGHGDRQNVPAGEAGRENLAA